MLKYNITLTEVAYKCVFFACELRTISEDFTLIGISNKNTDISAMFVSLMVEN
jgi:hypothetical protein